MISYCHDLPAGKGGYLSAVILWRHGRFYGRFVPVILLHDLVVKHTVGQVWWRALM